VLRVTITIITVIVIIIIIVNHKALCFTYCLYNHVVQEEPIHQIFFVITNITLSLR